MQVAAKWMVKAQLFKGERACKTDNRDDSKRAIKRIFQPITTEPSDVIDRLRSVMIVEKDAFGFVGSRIFLTAKEGCSAGWITRYDETTDQYHVHIPSIGSKTYSRGEIIALHARFQIQKVESDEDKIYQDFTSRYVDVPIWSTEHRRGIVKCFHPFENLYLVKYANGKEERLNEDQVIDCMIALLKLRKPFESDKGKRTVPQSKTATVKKLPIDLTKIESVKSSKKRPIHCITSSDIVDVTNDCLDQRKIKEGYRPDFLLLSEQSITMTDEKLCSSTEEVTLYNMRTQFDQNRFYMVDKVLFLNLEPLEHRSIALKILRRALMQFLETYNCVARTYKAQYDILKNPDLKHYVSIRRFIDEAGLTALNRALITNLDEHDKKLRSQNILHVLKLVAMLPIQSQRAIEDSSIGRSIMLVIKSDKVPTCARHLAKWIKRRWLTQLALKNKSHAFGAKQNKLLGNGMQTQPSKLFDTSQTNDSLDSASKLPTIPEREKPSYLQSKAASHRLENCGRKPKIAFADIQSCDFDKDLPVIAIQARVFDEGRPKLNRPVHPILRVQSKYNNNIDTFDV